MDIQFLGHSAFRITTSQHVLIIDPFITGQGRSEAELQQLTQGATHILLTHGHGDHVGDTAAIAQANNDCPVVGMVELVGWLKQKHGVRNTMPINFGGTADLGGGVSVTLVPAWHSSAADDGTYLGQPGGLVIADGSVTAYHMGDTCAFLDMQLIGNLHSPQVIMAPIGGGYTMSGHEAALACHFVANPAIASPKRQGGVTHLIPIHYGTFPGLAPDADAFVKGAETFGLPVPTILKPGQILSL